MISHFFIDRPIFATVLSIVIVIVGVVAVTQLPVAQYPDVAPPQISINQYLYAKLPFDPEKDLLPIAQVASLPNILVVRKSLEVNSVKDLIDYAKAANSTMLPPAMARPSTCRPSCSRKWPAST